MIRVGIIAGGGELPLLVGNSLINKNFEVTYFVIEEFLNNRIYKNQHIVKIKLNSLKAITNLLKTNKINKIIMLGKVNRPSIKEIKFDFDTVQFIKNYFLENKGDNKLLISIQNYFLQRGFPYLDWKNYCTELFANKKNLTKKLPTKKSLLNKNKGAQTFKIFGKSDIGQSIIIQNEIILGLEAAEGTDELIRRCSKYKKSGDRGILIKLSKYNQNQLLDIPTIGLQTMKLLKKYNYDGVYLELNQCLIINKFEVIKYADLNNLFIATTNKFE